MTVYRWRPLPLAALLAGPLTLATTPRPTTATSSASTDADITPFSSRMPFEMAHKAKVDREAAGALTGMWEAESRLVQVTQTVDNVRTSAEWGTGVGTLDNQTLHILFSNSAHRYTGAHLPAFSLVLQR